MSGHGKRPRGGRERGKRATARHLPRLPVAVPSSECARPRRSDRASRPEMHGTLCTSPTVLPLPGHAEPPRFPLPVEPDQEHDSHATVHTPRSPCFFGVRATHAYPTRIVSPIRDPARRYNDRERVLPNGPHLKTSSRSITPCARPAESKTSHTEGPSSCLSKSSAQYHPAHPSNLGRGRDFRKLHEVEGPIHSSLNGSRSARATTKTVLSATGTMAAYVG